MKCHSLLCGSSVTFKTVFFCVVQMVNRTVGFIENILKVSEFGDSHYTFYRYVLNLFKKTLAMVLGLSIDDLPSNSQAEVPSCQTYKVSKWIKSAELFGTS